MSMNNTPAANRIHIGFFGKRNVGKSSLVNAITRQEISIVSETKGTTTDPVYKTMELLPLGPVMIIDTPGMDDEGDLGELRVKKTRQVLNKTDLAVLVAAAPEGLTKADRETLALFQEKEVPYLIVYNKSDLSEVLEEQSGKERNAQTDDRESSIYVSALKGENIDALKEKLANMVKVDEERFRIVGDLLEPLDTVVLVVPIDSAAPKGRLILPQQQVIRDILEAGAVSVVVKDTELKQTLEKLGTQPKLVITDSQAFAAVSEVVPADVPLTSFSILMARWKGFLVTAVKGAHALDGMKEDARILIAEGCTHHRQCEDIGTVKLPAWIRKYTGVEPEFVFCSGMEFPEDLSAFDMVIHCGACMLNEREVSYRMKCAINQDIAFTNYGTAIAHMNKILARSVKMLPEIRELLL